MIVCDALSAHRLGAFVSIVNPEYSTQANSDPLLSAEVTKHTKSKCEHDKPEEGISPG